MMRVFSSCGNYTLGVDSVKDTSDYISGWAATVLKTAKADNSRLVFPK